MKKESCFMCNQEFNTKDLVYMVTSAMISVCNCAEIDRNIYKGMTTEKLIKKDVICLPCLEKYKEDFKKGMKV